MPRARRGRVTQKYPASLNGPSTRTTILPDDLDEALANARACHELSISPAFQTSLQALEAFHLSAMVATPEGPDGAATRDHHHRMLAALRELASDVLQRASTVSELERLLGDNAEENELDEDEL